MVVKAPHCFGSHSPCRSVHFPVVEEDHRTGLVLCLALLRALRFLWHCSKLACQSVLEILQYTPGLEVLACSMDTDVNYCQSYSNNIFKPAVMLLFIILCIQEERKVSKPGFSGRVEIQNFSGTLVTGSPPGLSSGPAGDLTVPSDL